MSEALRSGVRQLLDGLCVELNADKRRRLERLHQLLERGGPDDTGLELRHGDAWAEALLEDFAAMAPAESECWRRLFAHVATATSAKPSKKWLGRARELLVGIAPAAFSRVVSRCLGRIGEPRTRRFHNPFTEGLAHPTVLDDSQTDLLRGLVWLTGLVDDPGLTMAVGGAADACFKKIENHGPRNIKVGNACLDSLSRLGTPAAVAQLSRLRARVRHPSTRQQIEAALSKAAERQGLTTAELEEMSVPTLGLTEVGLRRESLSDFTAELRVTGPARTELLWLKSGSNKPQVSVPKAVKESHPDELKALTATAKEIQKLLAGQRDRVERLFLHPREWDLALWRERYLDHPLVGTLARNLIWCFRQKEQTRTGSWHEGHLADVDGRPLSDLDSAQVSLWHPQDSPIEEVRAWRLRLEEEEVVQPFKQAHREIYLLTDAERQTGTYSNRFAAHLLKQHQFAALCRQRGWTYSLQGQFDSWNTPFLVIPEHGLQVEFWVEPAGEEATESGIYHYVATDQVRFCSLGGVPQPLERMPPFLFSELMRDVDLFVGVCSVGNDPTWPDQGEQHGTVYWRQFAFGELGESARIRRELLGRLLPRLKIAGRCAVTERFLVVRGDLRTYKIHLGSGNILMEPDDQYLCIVPASGPRAEYPILPFEGDGTLAIILSKAFLLAEDRKITDPIIVNQLTR